MVADQSARLKPLQQLQAFCGMRAKPDNVAQKNNLIHITGIIEHRFKRRKVRMYIRNPESFHFSPAYSHVPASPAAYLMMDIRQTPHARHNLIPHVLLHSPTFRI